jgi:DNA-binding response OmpR family regulator
MTRRLAAVIEDEKVLRESIAEMLAAVGILAETFETSAQFLRAASTRVHYDLCIVDINLPGMRGDDMLLELVRRGRMRGSVVLFLSGLEEREVQSAWEKVHGYFPAVDYSCKPVQAEALLRRIDALVAAAGR